MSNNNGNNFVTRTVDRFGVVIDKDWSNREACLHIYKLIYKGKLYDNLGPWEKQYQDGEGPYIPLAQRKPSVIYRIPKIIVDESTSMLFGESHFPVLRADSDIDSEDQSNTDFLSYLVKKSNIKVKMLNAAKKGALGSVCVLVKVLKGRFYLDVLETLYLTPIFDDQEPDKLLSLVEKRKVSGDTLRTRGYTIADKDKNKAFFIVREWNENEEIYYFPYLCENEQSENFTRTRDDKKSVTHDLGFVPAIWIKNTEEDDRVDGECTFESIIDICVEIDYQLSQLGRLLKYNADPTIIIKDPSNLQDQNLVKGRPYVVGENGDAWMLEMTTGSTSAIIEYVRVLREYALEVVHGNRANPDKLSALTSGKALQMLNANLISLVEDMRLTYGESGLKRVICMMLDIIKSGKFEVDTGKYSPNFGDDPMDEITLEWPDWYAPTPQDDMQEAQSLQILVNTGILSQEGALKTIADKYNITDLKKELTEAKNDASVRSESKISKISDKNPKNAVAQQNNSGVDRSKNRKL